MKNLNSLLKMVILLTLPIIMAFLPLLLLGGIIIFITPVTMKDVFTSAPFWIGYVILSICLFVAVGQELFD